MEGLADRLTLWILRSTAVGMLVFGTSMLVAGIPVASTLEGSSLVTDTAGVVIQIGIVLMASGAAATYLSGARRPLLPNEHATATIGERPARAVWPIALAIALVTLPIWLRDPAAGVLCGVG